MVLVPDEDDLSCNVWNNLDAWVEPNAVWYPVVHKFFKPRPDETALSYNLVISYRFPGFLALPKLNDPFEWVWWSGLGVLEDRKVFKLDTDSTFETGSPASISGISEIFSFAKNYLETNKQKTFLKK